jgi:hypothetical protein
MHHQLRERHGAGIILPEKVPIADRRLRRRDVECMRLHLHANED